MKKGFTLIELLAVIVILAIIAVIATPIVLNIIKDSKQSAVLRGAENYITAVEQAIMKQNLKQKFSPNTCTVLENGNVTCNDGNFKSNNIELTIEVSGEVPKAGSVLNIKNNSVVSINEFSLDGMAVAILDGKITNMPAKGKKLEEYTWAEIAQIAQIGGRAVRHEYNFQIGDTKKIDGVGVAVIVGYNHDTISSGGVASITFVLQNTYTQKQKMYNSGSSGWKESYMRSWLNNDVYNSLPKDLQNAIVEVDKISDTGGTERQIEITQDKLWLLSTTEIGFSEGNDYYQGAKYDAFTDDKSRIKKFNNGAVAYALRTSGGTSNFYGVHGGGTVKNGFISTTEYGVSFGFCIGTDKTKTNKSLDDYSWEEISEIANSGESQSKYGFKIGDTKTIDGVGVAVIAGFNYDTKENGQKAGLTFVLESVYGIKNSMTTSDTTINGWMNSPMRSWLNSTVYNSLPKDLQSVITPASKQSNYISGDLLTTVSTTDKLWLLSYDEINGSDSQQPHYPLFTDDDSRISRYEGRSSMWSSRTLASVQFYGTHGTGEIKEGFVYTAEYGVRFGFCI